MSPKDTRQQVPWENGNTEGFYRHCVASCRLNRMLIFNAPLTFFIALWWGDDWPSKDYDKNNFSDTVADLAGIAASFAPQDCRNSCEPLSKGMSKLMPE